jgi:hypothetical protein
MSVLQRFRGRAFRGKRKPMLLLEVLLSITLLTVLAVMLMSNLGYMFARSQKEKAGFAYEAQMQMFDLTILKLFEEISFHLQTSAKAHLPLYIDERDGKKNLIFFIFHPQDEEEAFTGLLKCTFSVEQGTLKLTQENDKNKKRERELLKAKKVRFEFFDPESKEWVDAWIKEREMSPPLLRVTITKEETPETLYYITPFFKNPLPI